jgi:transcriptional regulator with XRE-family HTH domain
MYNIVFDEEYTVAPEILSALRQAAGISQKAMGDALKRSQAHVQKVESRQRPIELVEFCRYARIVGADPVEVLRRILSEWEAIGCNYWDEAAVSRPR